MAWLRSFRVYEQVARGEARGGTFIKVRWVDVDKGEPGAPAIRPRLCAREPKFLNPGLEGTFAGTPPLEGLKVLLSRVATRSGTDQAMLEGRVQIRGEGLLLCQALEFEPRPHAGVLRLWQALEFEPRMRLWHAPGFEPRMPLEFEPRIRARATSCCIGNAACE